MPRKTNTVKKTPAPKTAAAPVTPVETPEVETPVATTAVRKTVAPKGVKPAVVAVAPAPITYERIAERAYYISQSGGGSEHENWLRAEAELRSEV